MEKTKAPGWFMPVAIILLIWNLIGVAAFIMDVMMTEEMIATLPAEQQEMYLNNPTWSKVVYGIATITGALACVGLVIKKSWSKYLFMISLLAVIIQFSYSLFGLDALNIMGPTAMIMPVVVSVIGAYQIYLSGKGTNEGWLT